MDMYMDNFLDNDATRRYARGTTSHYNDCIFLNVLFNVFAATTKRKLNADCICAYHIK